MGYVLGLDVGVTSIGWSCVQDSPRAGQPGRIVGAGVRVFPEGVDRDKKGGEVSKNASRRAKRGSRRQLDRKKRRRARIRFVLQTAGLWPLPAHNIDLSTVDPYRLRASALTCQLEPWQIGVAIAQLARRRGFKSNRRTDGGKETGVVYDGIAAVRAEMRPGETIGEFLDRRRQSLGAGNEHLVRTRGRYTLRAMFEQEFDAIWSAQATHQTAIMTDDLRERLRTAIFYQRPLKPADELVGFCELEPGHRRCQAADRAAQLFRILAEVSNLRIISPRGEDRALSRQMRDAVVQLLCAKEKAEFGQIREACGILDGEHFNLEVGKRTYLWGHRTDHALRSNGVFGKRFDALSEEQKHRAVQLVMNEENEDKLMSAAREEFGLDDNAARALTRVKLQNGYLGFSRKAIVKLTPHLREGCQLRSIDPTASAFALAGYLGRDERPAVVLDRLDAPPRDIRNPIVMAALHQVKRLVNAIVKEFGKPSAVHVELAREAQGSIDQRKERTFENAKRRKRNEEIADSIRADFGFNHPSRADIERYKLWQDFGEHCPYTGTPIPYATLFSPEWQVDHILPYSRSLDNSYANKALCATAANDEKGNQTPAEWLADRDPSRYEAVLQNVRRLWVLGQSGKARKFAQKTCELNDFIARQLVDTAYITRQLGQYLRRLGVDVVCLRGQTTADLRWRWGLDSALREDGLALKNRDDHRHHAIDAIVLALTDRSRLQALAGLDRQGLRRLRAEQRLAAREQREIIDTTTGEVVQAAAPWPGFRNQVQERIEQINVSHRPKRRVSGELHEETIYGATDQVGVFVSRKPLESLTPAMVGQIRDEGVRRLAIGRLVQHGIDSATSQKVKPSAWKAVGKAVWREPLLLPHGVPVRTVRVLKRDKTIEPLDVGNTRYVKTGSNHHVAIFEFKNAKGKAERCDVWVSRLEAAKRVLRKQPLWQTTDPKHPDARLIMILTPGDSVLADFGKGLGDRLMVFKTGASTQGQLYFVDARDARKGDERKLFVANANTTSKYKVRPVNTDLIGRIRDRYSAVPGPAGTSVDGRVSLIAARCVAAALSNTAAHKALRSAALAHLGGQLTAELKRLRARKGRGVTSP